MPNICDWLSPLWTKSFARRYIIWCTVYTVTCLEGNVQKKVVNRCSKLGKHTHNAVGKGKRISRRVFRVGAKNMRFWWHLGKTNYVFFLQKSRWSLFGFYNSLTFITLISLCFLPLARRNVACFDSSLCGNKVGTTQVSTRRSAGQVSQKIYNSSFWYLLLNFILDN